jgi:RNA polymerase sigma factor (sigma-70 family)
MNDRPLDSPRLDAEARSYAKAIALRFVKDDVTAADDIAQDAMLLAHRHLASYRGDARFSTWLYRVTTTAALMHLRRSRRRCREVLAPTDDASWLEALPGRAPSGEATAPPASSAPGPAASIAWAPATARSSRCATAWASPKPRSRARPACRSPRSRPALTAPSSPPDARAQTSTAPCPLAHGDGQGPGIPGRSRWHSGRISRRCPPSRRARRCPMLPTFLLPVLAALATPARPASPPSVVAAYLAPGAVVFDLDRGEQLTVVLDDDGRATRAVRGRRRTGLAPADAPTLPTSIERIDLTVDHAAVIVRGDGRAVRVRLVREAG